MLTAYCVNDGEKYTADSVEKGSELFCRHCWELVTLKKGNKKIHHFSHRADSDCEYKNESDLHREAKNKFKLFLRKVKEVTFLDPEYTLGPRRADLYFVIAGNKIALEFQHSDIPLDNIEERTKSYSSMGVHVLWVVLTSLENNLICSPPPWLMWIQGLQGKIFAYNETGSSFTTLKYRKFSRFQPRYGDKGGFDKNYKVKRKQTLLSIVNLLDMDPVNIDGNLTLNHSHRGSI